MRGKVVSVRRLISDIRITPAYAGKRDRQRPLRKKQENHPRLCGEKKLLRHMQLRSAGSPPPMRGKVVLVFHLNSLLGITPAYAGKSPRFRHRFLLRRDHPRLCGEKNTPDCMCGSWIGSPPPMRGKVRKLFKICPRFRITPAYAGKSAPQLGQYWNA